MTLRAFLRLAAMGCCLSSALLAATPDPARARIETYRELGASFKAVNDGLRTDEVQTVLIGQAARHIRNVAQQQYALFPAGSGPAPGVKTHAKPEIWTKPGRFRAAQDAFATAAGAFQQAVNSGNVAAMRTAARNLGATCKSCHDAFRNRVD